MLFPGDHILVGDEEFPAVYGFLADRYELQVAPIYGSTRTEEIVETLMAHIDDQTRAVYLSHVSYRSGTILPIERIADEIKQKRPRVRLIVDGSQAVGQITVDLSGFHGYFYLGDGHKWLQGPNNVGFVYCRDANDHSRLLRLTANPLCVFTDHKRERTSCSKSGLAASAIAAARGALESATSEDSTKVMRQGNRELSGRFLEYLRSALSARPDYAFDRVYPGPEDPELRTGILSLDFGLDVDRLRRGLAGRGVIVSAQSPVIPEGLSNRISQEPRLRLSFSDRFNDPQDPQRACELLLQVVDEVAAD